MTRTIQPAPVRQTLTVKAAPARAFEVFTAGIGRWWPKQHHIGAVEPETIVIEPRSGGRWFERAPDGTECELGKVLVWSPPARLVLAWQLGADFKFDPDLITEVELNFTDAGDGQTRVDFEHRNLERFGERAEVVRSQIGAPSGWPAILALFAQSAASAPQ